MDTRFQWPVPSPRWRRYAIYYIFVGDWILRPDACSQLVKSLYVPGTPKRIGNIQETLQRLQRSPEGWQIADALLGSDDDKVRFFGALTFTVKINQDW